MVWVIALDFHTLFRYYFKFSSGTFVFFVFVCSARLFSSVGDMTVNSYLYLYMLLYIWKIRWYKLFVLFNRVQLFYLYIHNIHNTLAITEAAAAMKLLLLA